MARGAGRALAGWHRRGRHTYDNYLCLDTVPLNVRIEKQSALMIAAAKGRSDVVKLLLLKGARVDKEDNGACVCLCVCVSWPMY